MRLRCKLDGQIVEGDFHLQAGFWVQDKPMVSYHTDYWEVVEEGGSETHE